MSRAIREITTVRTELVPGIYGRLKVSDKQKLNTPMVGVGFTGKHDSYPPIQYLDITEVQEAIVVLQDLERYLRYEHTVRLMSAK